MVDTQSAKCKVEMLGLLRSLNKSFYSYFAKTYINEMILLHVVFFAI